MFHAFLYVSEGGNHLTTPEKNGIQNKQQLNTDIHYLLTHHTASDATADDVTTAPSPPFPHQALVALDVGPARELLQLFHLTLRPEKETA